MKYQAPYTTFAVNGSMIEVNGEGGNNIVGLKTRIDGLDLIISDDLGEVLCRGVLADFPGLTGATLAAKMSYFNSQFTESEALKSIATNSNQGSSDLAIGAFGANISNNRSIRMQDNFIFGINTRKNNVNTATGGSASVNNNILECKTGTSVGGYGVLRSKKYMLYRSGQGNLMMFTAAFTTGVANSLQYVGGATSEGVFAVGYSGANYGIIIRNGGKLEIQSFQVTTKSSTAENVTITLDGVGFSVPVTNGADAEETAMELAAFSYTGWYAEAVGDTVTFMNLNVGEKTGSFSYTATTMVGTFTELQNGATEVETFIAQADWNANTLQSGDFILDETKLNVYGIRWGYLGVKGPEFFVLTVDAAGQESFTKIHTQSYTNSGLVTSIDDPSVNFQIVSASLGSTTDLTVSSASYAGFTEGEDVFRGNTFSADHEQASIGTTLTNVIAIRVNQVFNSKVLRGMVKLIGATLTTDSATKLGRARILLNPTFTNSVEWIEGNTESYVSYTTTKETFSDEGIQIDARAILKNGQADFSLSELGTELEAQDVIAVAYVASGGSADASASLTWDEER